MSITYVCIYFPNFRKIDQNWVTCPWQKYCFQEWQFYLGFLSLWGKLLILLNTLKNRKKWCLPHLLYTGFFSRAGNFRVFRGFSKNRENILPRKITAAKNYLHEKGQSKITWKKKMFKKGFLSLMSLFVFRAMIKSLV